MKIIIQNANNLNDLPAGDFSLYAEVKRNGGRLAIVRIDRDGDIVSVVDIYGLEMPVSAFLGCNIAEGASLILDTDFIHQQNLKKAFNNANL